VIVKHLALRAEPTHELFQFLFLLLHDGGNVLDVVDELYDRLMVMLPRKLELSDRLSSLRQSPFSHARPSHRAFDETRAKPGI
jgi:hypothetical protein